MSTWCVRISRERSEAVRCVCTGDFKCKEVKTGFCRKIWTETGSSETFIGWKSGQATFAPLRDRMEGAWLWTLQTGFKTGFYGPNSVPLRIWTQVAILIELGAFCQTVAHLLHSYPICPWIQLLVSSFQAKKRETNQDIQVYLNCEHWATVRTL